MLNNLVGGSAVQRRNPRDTQGILAGAINTQQVETRSIFNTQQQSCRQKLWSNLLDTQGIGDAIVIRYSTNCRRRDYYPILKELSETRLDQLLILNNRASLQAIEDSTDKLASASIEQFKKQSAAA